MLQNHWNGLCFYYLSPKHTINHIGYFNKGNTGDECFRDVFRYLYEKHYPAAEIAFYAPDNRVPEGADLTVLGGGDVISTYFLSSLKADNMIAVGVGIPYAEFEPELARFKKVFLRDKFDAAKLGTAFAPDLAFLLPQIFKDVVPTPTARTIGISVMRTYFHPMYPGIYSDYILTLVKVIQCLVIEGFKIVLFPFGTNKQKPAENDMITCMDIRRYLNYPEQVTILKPREDQQVRDVYKKVAQMEFMICARFHSHIFAAALNVPFISLTLGRKCLQFMKMANLEDNLFKLRGNMIDLPIELDATQILMFFRARYWYRDHTRRRLYQLNLDYKKQMAQFEQEYVEAVAKHAGARAIRLYPESCEDADASLPDFGCRGAGETLSQWGPRL
jgi:polysaccharide pyruvyl transferase WcaK-like protein